MEHTYAVEMPKRRLSGLLLFAFFALCACEDEGPRPIARRSIDAANVDATTADTGAPDAGVDDRGYDEDATATDGGELDAAAHDASAADASPTDAVPGDAMFDDGGTDAGEADAGVTDPCDFAAPPVTAGAPAEQILPPTVAHLPGSGALLAWADRSNSRLQAILRQDDGTITDLGDIGRYALMLGARPFTWPAAAAVNGGFTVTWVEDYDDGGFRRYRFRIVELDGSGAMQASRTFVPGHAVHFTDVAPRLFDADGQAVVVYKGRTADALPQPRLVFRKLATGTATVVDFAEPHTVTWDGDTFAFVEDGRNAPLLTRMRVDFSTLLRRAPITVPAASLGTHRIAAIPGGYLMARGDAVFVIRRDGTLFAGPTLVARPGSMVSNGSEALVLGRANGGVATAWRIDANASELSALALEPIRTSLGVHPDAAAWTGSQWVVIYRKDDALDDLTRWTTVCR